MRHGHTVHPARTRRLAGRPRGFSLVEVSVAVLALAVVGAMGFNALSSIRQRSSYANGANDFLATLKHARMDAFSESVPVVVVVDIATNRYWRIADPTGDFALGSFDPATPVPTSPGANDDRLLAAGTLEAPARFGPSNGYGLSLLPQPWSLAPATTVCSFCVSGRGAISFQQDGTATLTGTQPEGGSISITRDGVTRRTYAVLARTGAVNVFER